MMKKVAQQIATRNRSTFYSAIANAYTGVAFLSVCLFVCLSVSYTRGL